MGCLLLDKNYEVVGIVEEFQSFIWTERFSKTGDFELYLAASAQAADTYKKEYYLRDDLSDDLMIIEDHEIETDPDDARFLKVTGRSLSSVLDRRIIWGQMNLSGNLQNGIRSILNSQVISPTDPNRALPFTFKNSTDINITSIVMEDQQLYGDNVLEVIESLCETYDIGFTVKFDDDTKKYVFELVAGIDRTYDQTQRPQVIFSPDFDNLESGKYVSSIATKKTAALVGGEGEGSARKRQGVSAPGGALTGLDRREMFVDASGISSDTDDGTLTTAQYNALLTQEGKKALAENKATEVFDGTISKSSNLTFKTDYFLGDKVQMEDEYGHTSVSRITEYIRSTSDTGLEEYPTLTTISE